jgi:type I restriction enzyme S subunit
MNGHAYPQYEQYKDSGVDWLGTIPESWEVAPLFHLLRERFVRNIGNHVRDVLSLSYGRIVPRDVDTNFGLLPESFETYQIAEPGNIVLRLTDLQNDRRSLRVGHVTRRGIITSAYVNLEAVSGFDNRFAYYLLNAYDLLKVFYGMGAGVRQTMKFDDLKRMPCVLPSRPDQEVIARFLDRETARIDALIEKQERLIEKLDEKRKAQISKAVTQGLNPRAKMKDSVVEWLGRIPEHWSVTKLKYVAYVQTGITLGKEYRSGDVVEKPYLRVANVQDGHLDLGDIKTIKLPKNDVDRYALKIGDVLMTEGGDFDKLGRGCVWQGEVDGCLHQNHVFAVRPDRQVLDSQFLAAVLESRIGKAYFTSTSQQTTNLACTNRTKLRAFVFGLPPIHEQRAMVASINAKTASVRSGSLRIQRLVEKLREKRIAMIAAAVTGKIDVREVA